MLLIMKSIIHLNYSSDTDDTTLNINQVKLVYNREPIFEPIFVKLPTAKKTKKNLLLRTKNALVKLQPSHWFDGVWDDISIGL